MNEKNISQYLKEYAALSGKPSIELRISDSVAVVLVIKMQQASRCFNTNDPEIENYLIDFCMELLDKVPLSSDLKDALNAGWNRAIDFNNPVEPPDELN